jgi:3-oxoadipate enol-lactonase
MADVAGDVVDLLDAVGAPTAGFCGLSLGGCVGQWLGVNAPERVERLVLACTSPDFGPPGPWRERARAVRAGGTAAVADVVVGRWFTHTFAADRPEVVARFRQMLVDSPDEGYAGCCDALAEWSFAAELPRLRAPTLVIAAAEDPAAPPAAAADMAAALPDARLTVLEQASHLACIEQPRAFGRAVRAHLDGEETA